MAEGAVLNEVFKNGTDAHATVKATGENTVGADKSALSWTLAAILGELDAE